MRKSRRRSPKRRKTNQRAKNTTPPIKTPESSSKEKNLRSRQVKQLTLVILTQIAQLATALKDKTTINIESGSKDRINVNLRKDFKISDPEIFPIIDSKTEKLDHYQTTNYKYGASKDPNCQFIGTVYKNETNDAQYQLCGKTISELVFTSEDNTFYHIKDYRKTRYFEIQLPESKSKEKPLNLVCDSVINLRNTTDPSKVTEPVFLCKYDLWSPEKRIFSTFIGFLSKSRPGNFRNSGNKETSRVMKLHVCPYIEYNHTLYTNWLIATYEMKSFNRAQKSDLGSSTQTYFYNYESRVFNTLNFSKINLDPKLNSVGGLCVRDIKKFTFEKKARYFFVLQSIPAKNFDYEGFNHVSLFHNFSIFESKTQTIDFDDITQKLKRSDLKTFIKLIKGIPMSNEVLVITKQSKRVKYESCIMTTAIERNEVKEPFTGCIRILEIPTEEGIFDEDFLEFGRAEVQGERGTILALWRESKQNPHGELFKEKYRIAEIFTLEKAPRSLNPRPGLITRPKIWKLKDRIFTKFSHMISKYDKKDGHSFLSTSYYNPKPEEMYDYLFFGTRHLMRTLNENSTSTIKIALNSLGLYGPTDALPSQVVLTINRSPGQIYEKITQNRTKIAEFQIPVFADYYDKVHDLDSSVKGNDISFRFLDNFKENAEMREGYNFLVENYDFGVFESDYKVFHPSGNYLVALGKNRLDLYKCLRYRQAVSRKVMVQMLNGTEEEISREFLTPKVDCGKIAKNKPVPIKSLIFASGEIEDADKYTSDKDQPISAADYSILQIKNFKLSLIIATKIAQSKSSIRLIRIDKYRMFETNTKIQDIAPASLKIYERHEYLVIAGINTKSNRLEIFKTDEAYNIATLKKIFESPLSHSTVPAAGCIYLGFDTASSFQLKIFSFCKNYKNEQGVHFHFGVYTFFAEYEKVVSRIFNRYQIDGFGLQKVEFACVLDDWAYVIENSLKGPLHVYNVEEMSIYDMRFKDELFFTKVEGMFCLDNFVALYGFETPKKKRIVFLRRGGDKFSINTRVLMSHIFEDYKATINIVTESRDSIYIVYTPSKGLSQKVLFINTHGPQFYAKFNGNKILSARKVPDIGLEPINSTEKNLLVSGVKTEQVIGIFKQDERKTEVSMKFIIKEQNNSLIKYDRFSQEGRVNTRKDFNQKLQIFEDFYVIEGPLYEAFISNRSISAKNPNKSPVRLPGIEKIIDFNERITRDPDLQLSSPEYSQIKKIGILGIRQCDEYLVIFSHQNTNTLFNILHRDGTFIKSFTIKKYCQDVILQRFRDVPGKPSPKHGVFLVGSSCLEKGVFYLYFIQTLNSTGETLHGRRFKMKHPVMKFAGVLSYPTKDHRGLLKIGASYIDTRELQIMDKDYSLDDLMQVVQEEGKTITTYDEMSGQLMREVLMFDFVLNDNQKDVILAYHDEETKKISGRIIKTLPSGEILKEVLNDIKDSGLRFKGFFCKPAYTNDNKTTQATSVIICAFLTTDHRIGYRMMGRIAMYNFVQFGQRFYDLTFQHVSLKGDFIISHSESFTRPARCILIYKINSTVPKRALDRDSKPLYLHAAIRDLQYDQVSVHGGKYTLSPVNLTTIKSANGANSSGSANAVRFDSGLGETPNKHELAYIYLIEKEKIRKYKLSQMSIKFKTRSYSDITKYSIYSYGLDSVLQEWPLERMFMEKDKVTLKWVVILMFVAFFGFIVAWIYKLQSSHYIYSKKKYQLELEEGEKAERAKGGGTGGVTVKRKGRIGLELNQLSKGP